MSTQPADTGFARPYEPYPLQVRLAGIWALFEFQREALLGFLMTIYAIVVLRMIRRSRPGQLADARKRREVAENGFPGRTASTDLDEGCALGRSAVAGQLIFSGARALGGFGWSCCCPLLRS